MHGVPADLDLRIFLGATLDQLGIGPNEVQFNFGLVQRGEYGLPLPGQIMASGDWELRGPDGAILDRAVDINSDRESYRLHLVLSQIVTGFKIDAPKSFTLQFDNAMSLTFFDDSEWYESISILPCNIFI